MSSNEIIGGEAPVSTPAAPQPPKETVTVREPLFVMRFSATGVVFEVALEGDKMTYENMTAAFQKVLQVTEREPLPEPFEWFEEDEESPFEEEEQIEFDFDDEPYDFYEENLRVGDKVIYTGGANYGEDIMPYGIVGTVADVRNGGAELCVTVRFPGWTKGHGGFLSGALYDTSTSKDYWNFWYDEEGNSDEGHLRLAPESYHDYIASELSSVAGHA